jgi:hypothetical protein
MQTLPTALTTADLEELLSTLSPLPTVQITRYPTVITVRATRKATGQQVKILSALTSNGSQWVVRAVPGLISTTFTN